MDSRVLAAVRSFLAIGLALVLLVLVISPAAAQLGSCPDNSYLLAGPDGTWPDGTLSCVYNQAFQWVGDSAGDYPCDQYVHVDEGAFHNLSRNTPGLSDAVAYVPLSTQWYGQTARVRFMIFGLPTFGTISIVPPGIALDGTSLHLSYHNQAGNIYSYFVTDLDDMQKVYTWYDSDTGVNHYYVVYLVDQALPTSEPSGGYVQARIYFPSRNGTDRTSFGLASFRVGGISDTLPIHCSIPNASLPATPSPPTPQGTLVPTWTPNPTYTVTPTPVITPGATAAGGTPLPAWTLTPFVYPTLPAESTPTPWPPYQMPTIVWPTIDAVTIVPGVIGTVVSTTGDLDDLQATVDANWDPSFADSMMDTTITTTTGYGAPITLVMSVTNGISLPISYAKAVGEYLPNTGVFIVGLFSLAAWIMFNYIAKFAIQVVVFIFELIRRIWDALPLT